MNATAIDDDPIDALRGSRVLPVVTIADVDTATPVARALVDGGIPVAEITLRTPAALEAIERVARDVDGVLVGAGSVMSTADVEAAVDAGARFVVSPGLDLDVLDAARSSGVPAIPGVATATDVQRAWNASANIVKVFPAEIVGGVALIEAFTAVWPSMQFLPTGGITASNAARYLDSPSVIAVGGSWMVPADAIAAHDWSAITRAAASAAALGRGRP